MKWVSVCFLTQDPGGKVLVQAWNKSLEINDKSDRGVNVL